MAYTVRDTPAVVARIDRDLAFIRAAVTDADSRLRSLVLTGGFARGEGAVLDGVPQNDYDLVAIRGAGTPDEPYERIRYDLEARLGVKVDLEPVSIWRLRWTAPTIFWYETALRGRVIAGDDYLGRIRIREPSAIDPREGMRLLVNRAAGLLLVTEESDDHARRLQAAKALLAALDAQLLARGAFPPSQTERWHEYRALLDEGRLPGELDALEPWLDWAYQFKVDPERANDVDAAEAWRTAAGAVLASVPKALAHAGIGSLESYAREDGLVDRLIYLHRSARIHGARRWVGHPTGQLRVATLRLLRASSDGRVRPDVARVMLRPLARNGEEPLRLLRALRGATLQ